MALTDHIQDIITAAEMQPASQWKNRGIAHLRDALACFHMQDAKTPTYGINTPQNVQKGALNVKTEVSSATACGCIPGMTSATCPVHGRM